MKIETQFKIDGNTQKFNMILTMFVIIIKNKSYILIFCTLTNSYALELVWISFHVIVSKPFNQHQASSARFAISFESTRSAADTVLTSG